MALDLAYSPSVPRCWVEEMELAGRRMGLPLATIERLGQSSHLCRAFVLAARRRDRLRLEFLAGVARDVVREPLASAPAQQATVPAG